ncbi:MAG TPA: hypothetical protein ENI89_01355 [Desulfobulbus sp.]|nr:hypothetical protein [Desulfobulbus sp.]
MNWNIKKSNRLKKVITADPGLMSAIAGRVEKVFKKFDVRLPGMSYVFEPRVFTFSSKEVTELAARSRAAMLKAVIDDLVIQDDGVSMDAAIDHARYTACIPQCGPLDPFSLKVLEKLRIINEVADDPVPIRTSGDLMRRIVTDRELMAALTNALFPVLEEAGIRFGKHEGCVFTPVVFPAPVYAQKVGVARRMADVRGFGPQLYIHADPTPEPAASRLRPLPGIIEMGGRKRYLAPAVIIDRWWWVGIPAPELLHALDLVRKYG